MRLLGNNRRVVRGDASRDEGLGVHSAVVGIGLGAVDGTDGAVRDHQRSVFLGLVPMKRRE